MGKLPASCAHNLTSSGREHADLMPWHVGGFERGLLHLTFSSTISLPTSQSSSYPLHSSASCVQAREAKRAGRKNRKKSPIPKESISGRLPPITHAFAHPVPLARSIAGCFDHPSRRRTLGLHRMAGMLEAARKHAPSREILLWMTPSEAPKALQASECSELLDPMRASCWIFAQH